ncbi:MAG TPA: serine/threonine-protein kinase, partial [Kofleriaceae bacterium]|nr:serine/threonine-protein kinase [Kofleriaceae bacterium]
MIGTVQEGRYRVLRKLGEGGQGEVFLVEHVHLGRSEALKVLREEIARDEHFVARFRREARATNRVQHPNIVSVYDFGRLGDGRYFLAMEYVEGDRLDSVIAAGPMAAERAVRIGVQLARAAAHAHSLGVVHRDLKPHNLILIIHRGQSDVLKVLDFGMAKMIGAAKKENVAAVTFDGQMLGTAAYMAPEQFLEQEADARTDIYAIGCILYEMIAGVPPFAGSPIQLMNQHLRVAPVPPSQRHTGVVPPAYDQIVLRCLHKQPDQRFPSAAHLADELEPLAPPPGSARRTRRGMSVPRPLAPHRGPVDDFAGDTEDTEGTTTHPGDSGRHQAVTEPITGEVAGEVAAAVLQEVADALVDIGGAEARMVAAMAQLRDLGSQLTRLRTQAAEVEARAGALEQSMREREASLSFAIGELTFDRERGSASGDVGRQIAELQQRLAALLADARRELAALDDQAVALAAQLHDVGEARAAAAADAAAVLERAVARLAGD